MKMPGLIRGMVVIGVVYAVSGIVHRLNVHNCTHTYVRVMIGTDSVVADELCAIETLLTTLHTQKGYTVVDCITQAQAQFPYLYAGAAVFEPGFLVVYSFACSKPVCIVNDQYLLLDNGALVGKDILAGHSWTHLPIITLDQSLMQDQNQTHRVADTMAHIDPAITAGARMHWHTIDSGFLDTHDQAGFKVRFDVTHIPTAYILAYCAAIHHELRDSNGVYHGVWIADIRFNNQIIVYRGKGGWDG
jgi:hypothetical protein